jgi:hypothetical protein
MTVSKVIDRLEAGMTADAQPLLPESYRAGYRCALRDVRAALAPLAASDPGRPATAAAHGDRADGR